MEPSATLQPEKERDFLEAALKHWPIVVMVVSVIVTWTHFQTSLAEYGKTLSEAQTRISSVESSANMANVNYATLSGKIDTVNANINILLKANKLQ